MSAAWWKAIVFKPCITVPTSTLFYLLISRQYSVNPWTEAIYTMFEKHERFMIVHPVWQ